jgi:hypothetical protein
MIRSCFKVIGMKRMSLFRLRIGWVWMEREKTMILFLVSGVLPEFVDTSRDLRWDK